MVPSNIAVLAELLKQHALIGPQSILSKVPVDPLRASDSQSLKRLGEGWLAPPASGSSQS
jgi:hypothetical protein